MQYAATFTYHEQSQKQTMFKLLTASHLWFLWFVTKAFSSPILEKVDDSLFGTQTPRLLAVNSLHRRAHYVRARIDGGKVCAAQAIVVVHHVQHVPDFMSDRVRGGKPVVFNDGTTSSHRTHCSDLRHS